MVASAWWDCINILGSAHARFRRPVHASVYAQGICLIAAVYLTRMGSALPATCVSESGEERAPQHACLYIQFIRVEVLYGITLC